MATVLFISQVRADDWPQLLGPARNGQTAEPLELKGDWGPEATVAWRVPVGSGFAGTTVANGTVVVFHRQQDRELVSAYRLADGTEIWSQSQPSTYASRMDPDEGPRCVPVVHEGKIYCYGAAGDLDCLSLEDGKQLWRRELRREMGADDGYFGAGSTPIVVGEVVIVGVGSRKASVIALNKENGQTVWQCGTEDASYASPIAIDFPGGETRVLAVMRLQTYLIDPQAGSIVDQIAFGSRGPTVNAATPISVGENLYLLTASYGIGSLLMKVSPTEIVEVRRDKTLSSQYNTPVVAGDIVVGIDGREDVGVASLKGFNRKSLAPIWELPDFGTAHCIGIGGNNVLVMNNQGDLIWIDAAASDDVKPLAQTKLPDGTYRALPALVGNKLIVRKTDTPRLSEVLCIELK